MSWDLIVIGGGPGGYTAAIRAAQLGLRTALVERDAVGGTCLNRGCMPTKALLHSAEVYELATHSENIGIIGRDVAVDWAKVQANRQSVSDRLTGGVAALTTLEFEPGLVGHDLKAALDVFSPYRDEKGRVIHYQHHDTWHDDNGSSHIKALLLSPFITVPIVAGRMTLGPWQNLTLVECDTRDRVRDIVFQVMGE